MGIRRLCAWDRYIGSAVRVEKCSGSQLTCGNTDTLTWLPWLFAGHRVTPGAVSILADGLHLLLGETDYHRLPIYPHKHPSSTESVPKCYVNIAQASKLFHTWSTSYANNVTKITRSRTQCKKGTSPVFVRHTRLGQYSHLHESAISCHSSKICPPTVHIFKVFKGVLLFHQNGMLLGPMMSPRLPELPLAAGFCHAAGTNITEEKNKNNS